jgi:hypothetical protein
MGMTETHIRRCDDLALAVVQEECDVQDVEWTVSEDQTELLIPAWGMSMADAVAAWRSDGIITCHCHDW